ncbi:MAG: hypothetical protein AAF311_05270 [Pseudomonadota bacterium]
MKTIFKAALGTATAALFAGTAQAGMTQAETQAADAETPVVTTRTVQTLDADGQVGQLTLVEVDRNPQMTAVLGALAMQETDAYIVQDNDGALFINHLVPVEELPDPTLMVETLDTYDIAYRGMTFTNKVVDER